MVNGKGGPVAIGHPLARPEPGSWPPLAHRLRVDGGHWGVAATCIGVGQALAVVLENVDPSQ